MFSLGIEELVHVEHHYQSASSGDSVRGIDSGSVGLRETGRKTGSSDSAVRKWLREASR